jgi:hypothetical protein
MPAELQPTQPRTPIDDAAGRMLIRRVSDLVYLTEELYLRLFILTLLFTVIGCLLSMWFAVIGSNTSLALTGAFAATTLSAPCLGLSCCSWLLRSQVLGACAVRVHRVDRQAMSRAGLLGALDFACRCSVSPGARRCGRPLREGWA